MAVELFTDAINTPQGVSVNIDVLANDVGLDDLPIKISVVGEVPDGEAKVEADNTITFHPNPEYNGITSFVYQVVEPQSRKKHVATVYVYVVAPVPEIEVRDGLTRINPGKSIVDFGSTSQGQASPKTFIASNKGQRKLQVGSVTVPDGYSVVTNFQRNRIIPPGGQASFTIQLDSASLGSFAGEVGFKNDIESQNPFHFNVTGIVETDSSVRFKALIRENTIAAQRLEDQQQNLGFFIRSHTDLSQSLAISQNALADTESTAEEQRRKVLQLESTVVELQARVRRLSEQVETDEIARLTFEETASLLNSTFQSLDQIRNFEVRNMDITLKASTGKIGEQAVFVIPAPGTVDAAALHELKFNLRSTGLSEAQPERTKDQ